MQLRNYTQWPLDFKCRILSVTTKKIATEGFATWFGSEYQSLTPQSTKWWYTRRSITTPASNINRPGTDSEPASCFIPPTGSGCISGQYQRLTNAGFGQRIPNVPVCPMPLLVAKIEHMASKRRPRIPALARATATNQHSWKAFRHERQQRWHTASHRHETPVLRIAGGSCAPGQIWLSADTNIEAFTEFKTSASQIFTSRWIWGNQIL